MGSTNRKQTMAKMARERARKEKRELKQQKKEDRKQAAIDRDEAIAAGTWVEPEEEEPEVFDA